MSSNKPLGLKIFLAKRNKQNRIVPLWAVIKTARKVRSHPKRRYWRASNLKA